MKKIFIILSLLFSLTLTSANAVEVTQEAKITGLYVAFFNRAADQEGLTYWTTTADNVAKEGGDVSSVFKTLSGGFATHPTFTSTYGDLNNEAFVAAIYRNALGRDGDAEGVAYWTDLVDRGMSRSDMVATFVELSMVTDLTPANYPTLSAAELAAAQLRQNLITNKVNTSLAFTKQLDTLSNVENSDAPESDPAYLASIEIISEVTEELETVNLMLACLHNIRYNDDPIEDIISGNCNASDTVNPVITITGGTTTMKVGEVYTAPVVTASDDKDEDITASIVVGGDSVNANVAGTYSVTYNVTDSAGNHADTVTHTVVVGTPLDSSPDSFDFYNSSNLSTSTTYSTNTQTISGINTEITASTTVGSIVVNGTSQGATAQVVNGDTVSLSVQTSSNYATLVEVTVTMGDRSDSFTFKTVDAPVNNAPTASSQNITVNEDTSNNAITLTGTDADGDSLSYTVLTQPSNGTLSGTAPNAAYTPNANYAGADSFTFKVNDGTADSAPATVSITVTDAVSLQTGYLIDSPVVGVNYECTNIQAKTGTGGKFECENKNPVTFKIGNLTLGTISSFIDNQNIYLQDIANVNHDEFEDEYVVKLAVLLQSLDDDGNIANEINIEDSIHSMFSETLHLRDINTTKLEEIIRAANKKPVFKYKAIEHLKNTFGLSSQSYVTVSYDRELISINGINEKIIKKINTATESSSPSSLITVGNYTYFTANYGATWKDRGLWRTDGTENGTILLKEGGYSRLTNVSNTLYLYSYGVWDYDLSTSIGRGLYKSDGSNEGTVLVKELPTYISEFIDLNGVLFFTSGSSLWTSDGTESGTIVVKEMTSSISKVTTFNDKIYFSLGKELWVSDGTDQGTNLVKDLDEDIKHIDSTSTKIFISSAFFAENTTYGDLNLWVSDGSASGTNQIKTIATSYDSSDDIYVFKIIGEKVYFSFNYSFWVSNGTEAGTIKLSTSLTTGNNNIYSSDNETTYILTYTYNNESLWKTDGTINGTIKLLDLSEYASMSLLGNILYIHQMNEITGDQSLSIFDIQSETLTHIKTNILSGWSSWSGILGVVLNGNLIFKMSDINRGNELWKSDGTTEGTQCIKDINTYLASSAVSDFTKINNTYYFTALDTTHGNELWKSDGTENGTAIVKDIVPGINRSFPRNLTDVNGMLFFSAEDNNDISSLWKTDGTENGTIRVKDNLLYLYRFESINNELYFAAKDSEYGYELWKSDGSEFGTTIVKDIKPGASSSNPGYQTNINGVLYFTASTDASGNELWKSDGTEAGTVMIKDIKSDSDSSYPRNLLNVNGTLFFTADDGIHGRELWKSDGTEDGTVLVKDITENSGSSSFSWSGTVVIDNDGYMVINGALWKMNNNDAKKVIQMQTAVENYNAFIERIIKFNNKILIVVTIYDTSSGMGYLQLWISDGTTENTKMLKEFKDSQYEADYLGIRSTLLGDKLFLDIEDDVIEEYKVKILTDGTSFGTGIVE